MPDTNKIDEPKAEVPKIDPPKEDIRFQAMANEIGRLKIEALAQSAGAIDTAKVAELVSKNTKASIDATGSVQLIPIDERGERLRMPNGDLMSVGQYVSVLKANPDSGYLFHDGAASKPSAKATGGLTTETNPWMADTWNLTQQSAIMKSDKVFGERLKAAAGQVAGAGNPFAAGPSLHLGRQAEILKSNPSLAEQLKKDAMGPENPWLKSQLNLTKQILINRSDPARAARLKAEAKLANGPERPKSYIFVPPPGSFRRRA